MKLSSMQFLIYYPLIYFLKNNLRIFYCILFECIYIILHSFSSLIINFLNFII